MTVRKNEIFGLIKTAVDAHTMGIHAAAALLRDCGYHVVISPENIGHAMESIYAESSQKKVLKWIDDNNISRIGFSYRLDPDNAVELMGRLYHTLESNGYYLHYIQGVEIRQFRGSNLFARPQQPREIHR